MQAHLCSIERYRHRTRRLVELAQQRVAPTVVRQDAGRCCKPLHASGSEGALEAGSFPLLQGKQPTNAVDNSQKRIPVTVFAFLWSEQARLLVDSVE